MINKKDNKQYKLGQYMTTSSVAEQMCKLFEKAKSDWVVFDPACGDGELLIAAIQELLAAGKKPEKIKVIGFDIDPLMVQKARNNISDKFPYQFPGIHIENCDTLKVLSGDQSLESKSRYLKEVNIIIGNPPYGKDIEIKFFTLCDQYFRNAELVFLMPMSFADRVKDVYYDIVKGRPLGVTTGHVITKHKCGNHFSIKSKMKKIVPVNDFSVLTGIKIYENGEGNPPQTKEIVNDKPFSSEIPVSGWLPCLRTGDINKFTYNANRLWVLYGPHLAHPKEIERFEGPKIFVRRVPIWSNKTLGAAYCEDTILCAGDVLLVRHSEDDKKLLKGLCVFLNSEEVSNFIIKHRPSVGYRDSFPKISAKDLMTLMIECLPDKKSLLLLAENYEDYCK
jgi:predicted RNA methylase